MLSRRRNRLFLLAVLIALGLVAIWIGVSMQSEREADAVSPMDIEWADGHAYATLGEGQILKLTVDGDEIQREVLAEGLDFPRGLAVAAVPVVR